MKKVGIIYNNYIENSKDIAKKIGKIFEDRGISFEIFDLSNMQTEIDMGISIGGDGTLLKMARYYSDFAIPVLGVNTGHLGFLSQIQVCDIEKSIDEIIDNKFYIEQRTMIEGETQGKKLFALNDIVVKGCTFARTSRFSILINDNFVCEYLADGIIISTPTGSTAYNLSAGGPILYPTIDAFTIVPICPHTITARPLVIPNNEKITIVSGSKDLKLHVNADGQEVIDTYGKINIQKADKNAHLVLLNQGNGFYSVLRQKLNWGTAPKPL